MIPRQCPVCSASDIEELIALEEYPLSGNGAVMPEFAQTVPAGTLTIGICNVCGFLFQINPVPLSQLDEMLLHQPHPLPIKLTGMEIAETDRFLRTAMKYVVPGAKVLDIGCGTGYLLEKLHEKGCVPFGIDAHPGAVEQARALGFEVLEGRFEEGMFEENAFDMIIARSVLEHTIDPMTILSLITRLLKPGGIFAIEVPNLYYVLKRAAFGGFSFHHVGYWTTPILRYALTLHGLDLLGGYEESYAGQIARKPVKGEETLSPEPVPVEYVEQLFEDVESFLERKERLAVELPRLIENRFSRGVITFGAGTPTVDLLYYTGLDDQIIKIVTSDQTRIGAYLAASNFIIESVDTIREGTFDAVLVSSERRQDELVRRLSEYRKNGGQAIRFTPDIEVI